MWSGNDDFIGNGHQKCVHIHVNGVLENGKGVEIDDCMMIEDNDILFFSTGENFISLSGDDKARRGEELPKAIGGYKVGSFLGKGGFGEVRIGEHQLTGEKVAMKFISKRHFFNIDAVERTAIEIQCLMALRHENIIRFIQHLDAPAHVVLLFELMSGGDLYNYMRKRVSTGAPAALDEDEARYVFLQILNAVGYAHNQHICHRDLKLENILLKENTPQHVKIADFGLSDFYRPGALVKTSCGTLSFLAPEVFRGTSNAGPPVDVWAMGVILFSLLCGRLPFEGNDAIGARRPKDDVIRSRILKCQYKIDDGLSPEAKDLVRRMLRLDPTERATIPELFNHCWLRMSPASPIDFNARARAIEEEALKLSAAAELSKVQLAPLNLTNDDKERSSRKSSFDNEEDLFVSTYPTPRMTNAPTSTSSPRSSGSPGPGAFADDEADEHAPDRQSSTANTRAEELEQLLIESSITPNQTFRLVPLRRQLNQIMEHSPVISRVNSANESFINTSNMTVRGKPPNVVPGTFDDASVFPPAVHQDSNANSRSQTAKGRKNTDVSDEIRKNMSCEVFPSRGPRKDSDASEGSIMRFSTQSPRWDRDKKISPISLAGASSLKPTTIVSRKNGSDEDDLLRSDRKSTAQGSPSSSHYTGLPRKPQIPKQTRASPADAGQSIVEKSLKPSISRAVSLRESKSKY